MKKIEADILKRMEKFQTINEVIKNKNFISKPSKKPANPWWKEPGLPVLTPIVARLTPVVSNQGSSKRATSLIA